MGSTRLSRSHWAVAVDSVLWLRACAAEQSRVWGRCTHRPISELNGPRRIRSQVHLQQSAKGRAASSHCLEEEKPASEAPLDCDAVQHNGQDRTLSAGPRERCASPWLRLTRFGRCTSQDGCIMSHLTHCLAPREQANVNSVIPTASSLELGCVILRSESLPLSRRR